jgi:hypothetical protein
MTASPSPLLAHWRQLDPAHRKAIGWLIVFLVLVLLLSIATMNSSNNHAPLGVQASPTTTTTSPKRSTPVAVRMITVASVADGRTIIGSSGEVLVVEGLAVPGPCWADAALAFAKMNLDGKQVQVDEDVVKLPDGEDFAVLMASRGLGRLQPGGRKEIGTAQDMAKFANLGLWGTPCAGADTTTPPPPPPPVETTTVPPPPPPPAAPAPTTPAKPTAVYYADCDAVRAAGAAPLYFGQPGYRVALDPDRDGVACGSRRR